MKLAAACGKIESVGDCNGGFQASGAPMLAECNGLAFKAIARLGGMADEHREIHGPGMTRTKTVFTVSPNFLLSEGTARRQDRKNKATGMAARGAQKHLRVARLGANLSTWDAIDALLDRLVAMLSRDGGDSSASTPLGRCVGLHAQGKRGQNTQGLAHNRLRQRMPLARAKPHRHSPDLP